jgi:dinuclear metal center YbgI/SA1388 family protein
VSVVWCNNVNILSQLFRLMLLADLVRYLDAYLRIRDVPDAPEALNGLQVENAGEVTRVAAAVDLCDATVRLAAEQGADLLLVHHGLFWRGLGPLSGRAYRRVAGLIRHNIALYSAHIPLDLHADVGNNVVLARKLGVALCGPFGEYHGASIGVLGELVCSREALQERITAVLGAVPRVMAFGPGEVRRVGIVTGAAGSMIEQATTAGLDTFITGEGTHHTFFDAEELRLNVFYAGHYATETVGVQALAEHLSAKFGLPGTFLDHPTGL